MIIQQIRNIKSGPKELRNFGITMAVALAIIGSFLLWRRNDYYTYLYAIAGVFLVLGLLLPVVLKPIHKVWMTLSILLGWVMTRLILCILFYLVFTPIGLLAKLIGKKFLNTRFDRNADSYWIMKDNSAADRTDYERQF